MESNEIQKQDHAAGQAWAQTELSDREREILALVAGGASNKEVALQLVISPNTVKVHLRNIFGKIGVSSRTEAALYAVRAGLVPLAEELPAEGAELPNDIETAQTEAAPEIIPVTPAPGAGLGRGQPARPVRPRPATWLAVAVLTVAVGATALLVIPRLRPAGALPTQPPMAFSSPPRWEARRGMPTARSRLATVAYENLVYAIGGETEEGVIGLTERYSPAEDAWVTLAPKPVAVADVGAAVIGGRIYVPGGRMASGTLTTTMEAYDPDADEWTQRASLPVALSGYALTSFEGRLYLFGGWNGTDYVASVYEYNPATDAWIERTRMPTARGFAAAAPASGKIFVIGGTDGKGTSQATEAYVPARDSDVANPWESLTSAPDGHSIMGAATIADTLYVAGKDEATGQFAAWSLRPADNSWTQLEQIASEFSPDWLSVAAVQTRFFVLGAPQADDAAVQVVAYQALYTNLIPVISNSE